MRAANDGESCQRPRGNHRPHLGTRQSAVDVAAGGGTSAPRSVALVPLGRGTEAIVNFVPSTKGFIVAASGATVDFLERGSGRNGTHRYRRKLLALPGQEYARRRVEGGICKVPRRMLGSCLRLSQFRSSEKISLLDGSGPGSVVAVSTSVPASRTHDKATQSWRVGSDGHPGLAHVY